MSDDANPASLAARSLRVHLEGPTPYVSSWLQAIGVGASDDGRPTLVVYTKIRKHHREIPAEWLGYPVIETYVGKIEIRPPR